MERKNVIIDNIHYRLFLDNKTAVVHSSFSETYDDDCDRYFQDYHEYSGAVDIPPYVIYNDIRYEVICIENFYGCSELISITLPISIQRILSRAFIGCQSIAAINIPANVTTIGEEAFNGCRSLQTILWNAIRFEAPDKRNFYGPLYSIANQITSFEIGNDVECLPSYLCYGMKNLTSISIPSSVYDIGKNVFSGCTSLQSIVWNVKTLSPTIVEIFEPKPYDATRIFSEEVPIYSNRSEKDMHPFAHLAEQIIFFEFGNEVEIIPERLCTGMGHLISISLPTSLEKIENEVFMGCSALRLITFPNRMQEIGERAFAHCNALSSVILPNGITCIRKGMFYNCTSLVSITIPDSVTSIEEEAFYNCSSLLFVNIPNSVTYIGARAFYGCISLTSIVIPNSVTSIGNNAFGRVPNVTYTGTVNEESWGARSVNGFVEGCFVYEDSTRKTLLACSAAAQGHLKLPYTVTKIGSAAFADCSSLTSLSIPYDVTIIESMAFANCKALTSIELPYSLEFIGKAAFLDCKSLKSVNLGGKIKDIKEQLFKGCSSMTTIVIPDNITSIGCDSFCSCDSLTSVKIGKNVTNIGARAFKDCSALNSIDIPNSVTSIGSQTFYNCFSLKEIIIGNCITTIEYETFYNCSSLVSITIPSIINNIDTRAFYNCKELSSITISNSVVSIGESAFYGCKSLNNITIPENVTSIGSNAFYKCYFVKNNFINNSTLDAESKEYWGANFVECEIDGLLIIDSIITYCRPNNKSIIIPETITGIEKYAFRDTEQYKNSAHWDDSVLYIDKCVITASSNISDTYTIKDGTRIIADEAFNNCKSIKSIVIPNGVTIIGERAFYGCKSLRSITIPKSVTTIRGGAFYSTPFDSISEVDDDSTYIDNCLIRASKKIAEVYTITEGTRLIADEAFYNCKSLISVVIPCSVKIIGTAAFAECLSLTSITIPDGVTSIKEYSFCNCESLTSIYIPDSVTNIENYAFLGCTALTEISLPGNLSQIGTQIFDTESLQSINVPVGKKEEYCKLGLEKYRDIIQEVNAWGLTFEQACSWEEPEDYDDDDIKYLKEAAEWAREAEYWDKIIEEEMYDEDDEEDKEEDKEEYTTLKPKYLFFNTECNGLPQNNNAPFSDTNNWPRLIQLAWILTDEQGNTIKHQNYIIHPKDFLINSKVTELTGISTERAQREGVNLNAALTEFMTDLVSVEKIISHNVDFNCNIVGCELYRIEAAYNLFMNYPRICTMRSSTNYCAIPSKTRYGGYKWPKLEELYRKLFDRSFSINQDALADVEAIKKCFFELKKKGVL